MEDRRGMVLIYTFIVMLMISIVAAAFLFMASGRARTVAGEAASAKAFWLAEAGIQQVMHRIRTDFAYRNSPTDISSTSLGGGTYSVTVTKAGNAYMIASTGTASGVSRLVRSLTYNTGFSKAILGGASGGGTGVTMSGTAIIDSYDSSIGSYNVNGNVGKNADIATNGDVSVSGGAYINGDVSTGATGIFNDQSAVSGAITHNTSVTLPAVTVPSLSWSTLPEIKNNKTTSILSGNYTAGSIDIGGHTIVNVTGPANIRLTGTTSISIGSQAIINVTAASTGPVIVYANGNVSIGAGGIANASLLPPNFQLYGYGTAAGSYVISGGSDFYGVIYAPTADLTMAGNSALYGAFVGNTVSKMTGSSAIHYDQSVINVAVPAAQGILYEKDWRETYI